MPRFYVPPPDPHHWGCQNNNPFEAEKSSSMDKKDNYNTEAVEELIVNWRKLMLQQETQKMHIVNFYFCFNTLIINLLSDIHEKMHNNSRTIRLEVI